MTKHFLKVAHDHMISHNQGRLWKPGTKAYIPYLDDELSDRTFKKAQKDGYLTKDVGRYPDIPALTKKGFLKF